MKTRTPVRSTNEFRRARSVDSARIVDSSDLTGKEGRWESASERDTIASAEASTPNGLEALPPFASVEINCGQAIAPAPHTRFNRLSAAARRSELSSEMRRLVAGLVRPRLKPSVAIAITPANQGLNASVAVATASPP
jgi:hypothetical protein